MKRAIAMLMMIGLMGVGGFQTALALGTADQEGSGLEFKGNLVTADLCNVLLKNVLKVFQKKKGIEFKGDETLFARKISIKFKDLPVKRGVKRILSPMNYVMLFDKKGQLTKVIILGRGEARTSLTRAEPSTSPQGFSPPASSLTAREEEAFRIVKQDEPPGPPVDDRLPIPEEFQVVKGMVPGGDTVRMTEEEAEAMTPKKMGEPPGGPVEVSPEEKREFGVMGEVSPGSR
jgi:hypothetical protein